MSHFAPPHLKKYIVSQNYKKYSPEDQALWRYIMKGVCRNLSLWGAPGGLQGMEKTGLRQDKIPKIKDIDKKLQKFGWRAVCVSGFIPPRAFMEFQMNRILPVASEIRSVQNVFYTPAPDIVHEAAGHIPFLTHPVFSDFLKKYASLVLKSITSLEDRKRYQAVRDLSALKENPKSSQKQIKAQERKLKSLLKNISHISESARLGRLIWWTSEYGLLGSLSQPKIYGAGLISSIGEALQIQKAKKIRLSAKCLNYPFNITEFQPQLFVAQSFEQMLEVLNEAEAQTACRRGGAYGADQALKSQTVNTVELESGLQISGLLQRLIKTGSGQVAFLKFLGPVQLCFKGRQIKGQGAQAHSEGFSAPLKALGLGPKPLPLLSDGELRARGLKKGQSLKLRFSGGLILKGRVSRLAREKGRLLLVRFENCLITSPGGQALYRPSWGPFDWAVGERVVSVFSGPADRRHYPDEENLDPSPPPPPRLLSEGQKKAFRLYRKALRLKDLDPARQDRLLEKLLNDIKQMKKPWLLLLELMDLARGRLSLSQKIHHRLAWFKKRFDKQGSRAFRLGLIFYKLK